MNYLALTQMVARESGTVSGVLPSAVTSQTGRLAKIVFWTNDAWRQIQNRRSSWRWMRAEFEGDTSSGSARYTAASWNITRWAEWITETDTVTLYKKSEGVADEGMIHYLDWNLYKRVYDRGEQTPDRPVHYTISPAGEFCLGPVPDDAYTVRGEYRKSPQDLAANVDVPEAPARFHEAIAWYALLLLAEHDEGVLHINVATRRYREVMGALERDQLAPITLGAALA